MHPQKDGRPQGGGRPKAFAVSQAGGVEDCEVTETRAVPQDEARRCEVVSRRLALGALCLGGVAAFSQAALATHYGRRSVALMREGGQ